MLAKVRKSGVEWIENCMKVMGQHASDLVKLYLNMTFLESKENLQEISA